MSPRDDTWTDQALTAPHTVADKAARVRRMFAAIASSYDLNNRLHSLGRDQAWRRAAVRIARLQPGEHVVDVACGTGDLSLAFSHAGAACVTGVDFTREMLLVARGKVLAARHVAPRYLCGDALHLPVATASADVVSIAFGIRNVADPAAAVAEFHRVLRPGGRLVILEFSTPSMAPLRQMYQFYFQHIMPRTAAFIARDRTGAYRYLPRSVDTFLGRTQMLQMIRGAGFVQTSMTPLTMGIAVVYSGVKAAAGGQSATEPSAGHQK